MRTALWQFFFTKMPEKVSSLSLTTESCDGRDKSHRRAFAARLHWDCQTWPRGMDTNCEEDVVVLIPQVHTLEDRSPECEADLHQHIHVENNILFSRAIAMEQAR